MDLRDDTAVARIPMSHPDLKMAEVEAVRQVLLTHQLSIGPRIAEFEESFAAYIGGRHGIGVSSGTAGLHLCVIAAGVEAGDLVITTPFSFVASANPILYERAIPVFVDIDPDTLNIDPSQVATAARELVEGGEAGERWLPPRLRAGRGGVDVAGNARGRLKAILPVHVFGQPADMDPILEVARKRSLVVIEDACEAIGAHYHGRPAGTLGHVAVFAFYPNKQMTTGEGGMIVTDHDGWDELFRSLRNQGRDVFDQWLEHSRLGFNYRLNEMSAALGLIQLERIEELLARRERVAGWYRQRLLDIEGIEPPRVSDTTTRMSWFVYVARLAKEIDRDGVMVALGERGIPTRPYFTPIHLQPFYRRRFGFEENDFPVAERVARTTLALPFFGTMGEEQVDYLCQQLAAVLREFY